MKTLPVAIRLPEPAAPATHGAHAPSVAESGTPFKSVLAGAMQPERSYTKSLEARESARASRAASNESESEHDEQTASANAVSRARVSRAESERRESGEQRREESPMETSVDASRGRRTRTETEPVETPRDRVTLSSRAETMLASSDADTESSSSDSTTTTDAAPAATTATTDTIANAATAAVNATAAAMTAAATNASASMVAAADATTNAIASATAAAAREATATTSTGKAVDARDALAPEFRSRLERVIDRMQEEFGHTVEVVETYRTQARQDALYSQGRSRPGDVVTWTRESNHTLGRAADVKIDGGYDDKEAFAALARVASEEGLRTLGARDPGHLELAPRTDANTNTRMLGADLASAELPSNSDRAAAFARTMREMPPMSAMRALATQPTLPATDASSSTATAAARVAPVATVAQVAQVAPVAPVAQVASVAHVANVAASATVARGDAATHVAPSVVATDEKPLAAAMTSDRTKPHGAMIAAAARSLVSDASSTANQKPVAPGSAPRTAATNDRARVAREIAAQALATPIMNDDAATTGFDAGLLATVRDAAANAAAAGTTERPSLSARDARATDRDAKTRASALDVEAPSASLELDALRAVMPADATNGATALRAGTHGATLPIAHTDAAERIARVLKLQDGNGEKTLSQLLLRIDHADGTEDRIRIDRRGAGIGATLDMSDARTADALRSHVGELQEALARQGLDAESLAIRASSATRPTPNVATLASAAAVNAERDVARTATASAGTNTRGQSDDNRQSPREQRSGDSNRNRSRREQRGSR